MPERMTIEAALTAGYTVDTFCYPPFAYKGPRFAPTEKADCFTPLEAKLLKALRDIRPLIGEGWTGVLQHIDKAIAEAEDA